MLLELAKNYMVGKIKLKISIIDVFEIIPIRWEQIFTEVVVLEWWGNLRERGHWGDEDIEGRIILKWIFRKLEGVVGTGLS